MTQNAPLKGKTLLLGVGAQKAGTSWLYDYLDRHPQVCMSPIKEMHFFGYRGCGAWEWPVTHFRRKLKQRIAQDAAAGRERSHQPLRERIRMQGDIDAYRRFFRRRIGDAPVYGEITPAYNHLPAEEFAWINDHFARVRIVFLMRNPADRHWSQMRFSAGAETLAALEAQVAQTLADPKYRNRNDYATTLARLRATFRPRQLHLEFYERLFSQGALDRLCRFLGVDPLPGDFQRRRNVSVKMPLSPALRAEIAARLKEQYFAVDDAFDGDIPESWHRDMAGF